MLIPTAKTVRGKDRSLANEEELSVLVCGINQNVLAELATSRTMLFAYADLNICVT